MFLLFLLCVCDDFGNNVLCTIVSSRVMMGLTKSWPNEFV